jgi:hypothetical protein
MLRRNLQAVLLAVSATAPSAVQAAAPASLAEVVAVQPTRVADLVLLSRGFDAGLRQGMVCRVTRDGKAIAEVLLVDLRPSCSAALIVSVASRQSIRPGDLAGIKVIKS